MADGHKTEPLALVTHCAVVSRDLVRVLLTISALSNLEVFGANVFLVNYKLFIFINIVLAYIR